MKERMEERKDLAMQIQLPIRIGIRLIIFILLLPSQNVAISIDKLSAHIDQAYIHCLGDKSIIKSIRNLFYCKK